MQRRQVTEIEGVSPLVPETCLESEALELDRSSATADKSKSLKPTGVALRAGTQWQVNKLCVWHLAHAGFSHRHALKRVSNMIASWFFDAIGGARLDILITEFGYQPARDGAEFFRLLI
ncbi:MAG: hypothetical protein ACE1Z4_09925, partial [Gammaproteobacteria bacterium]